MKNLDIEKVRPIIELAVSENLGSEDMTSKLLFKRNINAKSHIISREEIMVCGMDVAAERIEKSKGNKVK